VLGEVTYSEERVEGDGSRGGGEGGSNEVCEG